MAPRERRGTKTSCFSPVFLPSPPSWQMAALPWACFFLLFWRFSFPLSPSVCSQELVWLVGISLYCCKVFTLLYKALRGDHCWDLVLYKQIELKWNWIQREGELKGCSKAPFRINKNCFGLWLMQSCSSRFPKYKSGAGNNHNTSHLEKVASYLDLMIISCKLLWL